MRSSQRKEILDLGDLHTSIYNNMPNLVPLLKLFRKMLINLPESEGVGFKSMMSLLGQLGDK